MINARTDACAVYGLAEAIRRANLYLEAARTWRSSTASARAPISSAQSAEVHGLLSVNLMDAVTGVKTELVPIPELARMGVARVSIPVASILVAHRALKQFFEALRASPTGILAGQTEWVSSFAEYTEFVGPEGVPASGGRVPAARHDRGEVRGTSLSGAAGGSPWA